MVNTQSQVKLVCIFGGSFNPPHIGHVRAAKKYCETANPDLLIVIPSFVPPHKKMEEIGVHHRLEMARLAFSDVWKNTEISDCEVVRGGKSYTLFTVKEISEKYPGCRIGLFVGSDMLLSFDTWFKAEELFELCTLYVMPRRNDLPELLKKAEAYREKYNADVVFIDDDFYEISSTELRDAVREGNDGFLKAHLSEKVYRYIKREDLYGKEH